MKSLKFLFRYFLFRSLRKVKNIESVIQSHGFRIYTFRLEAKHDRVTELIDQMGATEYARHNICFIATNPIINGVFIKHNLSDDDRLLLLFHEEAHIWNNHPNVTSFTNETDTQQEKTANLFLLRLRLLKAATYILFFAALLSSALLLLRPLNTAAVADEEPQAVLQTAAYTAPEEDPIPEELLIIEATAEETPTPEDLPIIEASAEPAAEPTSATVYITPSGERYHRTDCYHIQGRAITGLTITEAENFSKTPCKTCKP